jgi:hypothetical protein
VVGQRVGLGIGLAAGADLFAIQLGDQHRERRETRGEGDGSQDDRGRVMQRLALILPRKRHHLHYGGLTPGDSYRSYRVDPDAWESRPHTRTSVRSAG